MPTHGMECPPAAVPARSKNNICVGHKELTLDAEDNGVEGCRGQGEEEHFEFKAHAEKNCTCQKWQDTGVNRVLRKKKTIHWLRAQDNSNTSDKAEDISHQHSFCNTHYKNGFKKKSNEFNLAVFLSLHKHIYNSLLFLTITKVIWWWYTYPTSNTM